MEITSRARLIARRLARRIRERKQMARIFREANKRFGPISAYGPIERNRFVIERFIEGSAKEFFADAARHGALAQDETMGECAALLHGAANSPVRPVK